MKKPRPLSRTSTAGGATAPLAPTKETFK